MGKKKSFVPFAPWEARKIDEPGYTRITASFLYSPAVLGLNNAAFRVFIYMRQHSLGKPVFEFPHSRFSKLVTKRGFQIALKELVEAGLVEVVENNAHRQKPNIYRFSAAWRDIEATREDGGGNAPPGNG